MNLRVGQIVKRKLLNCPIGWHYGAVVGFEHGIPVIFENTKGSREQLVRFDDFAKGQKVVTEDSRSDSPQIVIHRVLEALRSPKEWDLFFNCEHSCRKITQGRPESIQLQSLFVIAGLASMLVWAGKK